MRKTIRLLLLLSGAVWSRSALAQTPTLEFAPGAGNPTGTGPTTADQVITFQNNPDNPGSNTFTAYTPTTSVTLGLSNQQYNPSLANSGVTFGSATGGNPNPDAAPIFQPVNSVGSSNATHYTSTSGVTGGLDVAANYGVRVYVTTNVLPTNVPANQRYRYADLTLTFNQPTVNPVLHVTGLGGALSGFGFTTEFDLLTTGVTLSRLSGSDQLDVRPTQILNNVANPGAITGNGAASGSVLVTTPSTGITTLQLRIFLRPNATGGAINNGTGNTGDAWLLSVSELTPTVTGYVFEDVNYGGGAGRPRSASGTVGRPNATVELYDNASNFIATTTTDATGQYTFSVPAGTYTVRVVNSTVSSSRTGYVTTLLPVQTYNGTATRVGGENPALTDAGPRTGTQKLTDIAAQSIAPVTVTNGSATALDFGFNFDVVVNTNDVGQGSLRQFIVNSNALGGEATLAQAGFYTDARNLAAGSTAAGRAATALLAGGESSIFMIPTAQLTGGVAVITPATALPAITGPGTAVNGATQTYNIGNTNDVLLGTGGTVGTAAAALTQLNGPEVQLVGTSALATGLSFTSAATGARVRGLAIYGFGTGTNDTNANILSAASGLIVAQNMVGTAATAFTTPPTANGSDNIRLFGGTTDIGIGNNLIGFASGKGIDVRAAVTTTTAGTTTATISGNELRNNGLGGAGLDGIDLQGSRVTVTNNLITGNSGQGIDSFNSPGNNTIAGNTILGNGRGTATVAPTAATAETPGVRIYGPNNTIRQNVIADNYGAGIMLIGTTGVAATGTTISQNSIYNNGNMAGRQTTGAPGPSGQIGIDLGANGNSEAFGTAPYVTLNSATTTGANGLVNYPVLTSANVVGPNLVLKGYAKAGATIELFTAQANPAGTNATGANFGQGRTYLTTLTEGTNDTDARTGQSYTGNINGFNQGTDTNANGFTFTIPLSALTTGTLTSGTLLTSTATLANATSEFSGNVPVNVLPTANNDFATTPVGTAVTFAVTANDTPAASLDNASIDLDPNAAGIQTSYLVAGQGTFTTVGAPAGQVTFTPANGLFTGTVTIPYVVSNTAGALSNQANLSVTINPALDLATTLSSSPVSGPVPAASAVTYTVINRNNSTFTATNVAATLQLPPGLTSGGGTVVVTSATGSGTYDNPTGVVTFATTTLAATTSATYTVAVSKGPTSGTLTATATIASTGNGQEALTTNNVAVNTLAITPVYNVSTTLAGPVDTNGNPVAVVAGSLVTYTVGTTNGTAATSAAPNVVQTVSFDGNLTTNGLFISNGGTAAYNATTSKTTVTFPALATLVVGQSVPNTISFPAPANSYTATATVTANADNTGDTNTANNATATLTTTVKAAAGGPVNVFTAISTNLTQANPGDLVTLTATTSNAGPNPAANVVQQVQLPAGLSSVTFLNNNGSYNATTGLVTFTTLTSLASGSRNAATLPGGGANPNAFSVRFAAPATGVVLATAFVSQDNPDVVPSDNVAQVRVNVNSLSDVATSIEGPVLATVGQAVTYSVVTNNLSQTNAASVLERVQLPPNLGASTVTFGGPATGSYDNATGVVTFTFAGGLAAGSRVTNTVSFTMPASVVTDPSGTVAGANTLAVSANVRTATPESNVANNTALVTTTVVPTADVRVSLSGPASTPVGSPATYVITTTNDGAATAASVTPTLQLPAGLTNSGGVVTITGGGTYSNATGLVSFPTLTNLPNGGSSTGTVTVAMPDVTQLTPVAQVQVSAATIDRDLSNNRAQVTTLPASATTPTADLSATLALTSGSATPAPNAPITLTATFANAAGGGLASQVVPRLALPAGLADNGPVTVGNGGSYDTTTGLVTWPAVASLAAGSSLPGAYTVAFIAPSSGTVTAVAYVASATSDPVPANNAAPTTLTINRTTDVTTAIGGPAGNGPVLPGSRVTYTVVTTNAGLSPAANDVTQTVTIPTSVDPATVTFPAGSTTATTTDGLVITFPVVKALGVGSVVNYVSFNAPATNYSVAGTVSMTSDATTANNTSLANTTVDRTPVAYNVVNTLQSPQGSTAGALPISPLVATDADASSTLTYRLTSLPDPATGALTLNGAAITTTTVLTQADISNLTFNPLGTGTPTDPAFVGNAFFTYVAIDNFGATSAPALYTIQVSRDNVSTYTQVAYAGGKAYQNGNVVANALDNNGVRYSSTGQVYNTTDGTLVATDGTVRNGLTAAAPATAADATTLATNGLALDPATGQITVLDRTKLQAGTIAFNVTTTDLNGGVSTVPVNLVLASPLPVVLVKFEAQAGPNRDALLSWTTASELNSDRFEVERSLDGVSFAKIGRVAARGATATAGAYAFTDAGIGAKATGAVYYRLRQVDLDGTATYSPVRTVSFPPAASVAVRLGLFPNPAQASTQLDLSKLPAAGTYQIVLLDATGRTVLRTSLSGGLPQSLDLSGLATGTYSVLVTGQQPDGSALHQVLRLVKE